MIKAIPQAKLTPADELRDKLQRVERLVGNLQGLGAEAVTLLQLLDELQDLTVSLEAKGMDLRPERTRLDTVHNQLRSRAAVLTREITAAGGLPALRRQRAPDRDRWWWYLDEFVAERRRRRLRNWAITGVVILILLSIAFVAYNRFLAPDPLTRQKIALLDEAEILIEQGDISAALEKYRAALALDPNDAKVLIWIGVLVQQQGQSKEAEETFAAARAQLGSEVDFLVARGMTYAQLNRLDAAQADAEAALTLDPNSVAAHLLLSGVYEAQGHIPEAIAELQLAVDLAQQAGDDALYVLAKTRLALLLQAGGALPSGE